MSLGCSLPGHYFSACSTSYIYCSIVIHSSICFVLLVHIFASYYLHMTSRSNRNVTTPLHDNSTKFRLMSISMSSHHNSTISRCISNNSQNDQILSMRPSFHNIIDYVEFCFSSCMNSVLKELSRTYSVQIYNLQCHILDILKNTNTL